MNPQGFVSIHTLLISPIPIYLYLTLLQLRHHLSHNMAKQSCSQQNIDSYIYQSRPIQLNFKKSYDYSNCTWLKSLKLS
jgi:hypothetical protein